MPRPDLTYISPAAHFYMGLRAEATPPEKEPTPAELMEMAQKLEARLAKVESASEARKEAKEGIEEEADKQGLEISEEQAKMFADMMVAEFERRGAFPDAGGEGGEGEGEGEGSGEAAQVPPPPGGEAPAGAEGETQNGGSPPPPAPEEEPRHKSLAERFRGV
jgi:hypothetical protein